MIIPDKSFTYLYEGEFKTNNPFTGAVTLKSGHVCDLIKYSLKYESSKECILDNYLWICHGLNISGISNFSNDVRQNIQKKSR